MGRFGLMVVGIALVVLCADATAAVSYVDKDNTGPENGTSWATASNTIREGVETPPLPRHAILHPMIDYGSKMQ